jgi:hypothetical protein
MVLAVERPLEVLTTWQVGIDAERRCLRKHALAVPYGGHGVFGDVEDSDSRASSRLWRSAGEGSDKAQGTGQVQLQMDLRQGNEFVLQGFSALRRRAEAMYSNGDDVLVVTSGALRLEHPVCWR